MFLSELSPVLQKFIQQPVAFTGGFVSGVLRLKLNEPPLSSWLAKQGYNPSDVGMSDNNNKPHSISID